MAFETVMMLIFGTAPINWIFFFACIVFSAIIGKSVDFFVGRHLRKIAAVSPIGPKQFNEIIFSILEKPLWLVFVVIGFVIGIGFLNLPVETIKLVQQTIGVVGVLIITWIIVRAVDFVLKGYLAPMAANAGTKIDEQFFPILSKIIKIIIVIIAIAAIAGSLGYDLTAVIAGLGIGGLAIAFAAQATIADIFGGFSIFTSKHYSVGDVVNYEDDDIFGLQVEQIGLRYTYFRNLDGRRVIIPNSKIASMPITNVSSEKTVKTTLNIVLGFDAPMKKIGKAKKIIAEIIENDKRCEKNPLVMFSDFKEWGANIQAVYYIKDKANYPQARDSINSKIKGAFDREKIFFSCPSNAISGRHESGSEKQAQKKIFE